MRLPSTPVALLVAAGLFACGGDGRQAPRTITQERQWRPVGQPLEPGRSPAERFGFGERPPAASSGSELAWTTPPGWSELPPSSMRAANFLVAGDERTECYLTILGGDGGGLLSNVNRWRNQMSLPAVGDEALAAAPRAPLLGAQAVLIDVEGTWVGMGGDMAGEGYRLVGLIAVEGGRARFLKMTGPAEVVAPEIDAFLALAASFHEGAPRSDPHAGLAAPDTRRAGLTWTAPAGWRRADDRPMREVTFLLGEDGEGECYVTQLGGPAGGAFANVNRWCKQMGGDELSSAEFAALPRISMLGTEAVVVEVEGTYRGMGDELREGASLLGAVCELPDRAVFVKLIGPGQLVRSAREDFLSFCRSLEG